MELSASVVEGLHLAGDAAHIPDDSFDALVRVALDAVLTNKDAKRCLGKVSGKGFVYASFIIAHYCTNDFSSITLNVASCRLEATGNV